MAKLECPACGYKAGHALFINCARKENMCNQYTCPKCGWSGGEY